MNFTLQIDIDDAGLSEIYNTGNAVAIAFSAQATVISGSVADASVSQGTIVACAFAPFESNTVSWDANVGIYVTSTPLTSGATVSILSITTPATIGERYTFANGVFESPQAATPGTYSAYNADTSNRLAFGLTRTITVNGETSIVPIVAIRALYNETAFFVDNGVVAVFLSPQHSSGTVAGSIPDNALTITLSSTAPEAQVGFNDQTQAFFLTSSS